MAPFRCTSCGYRLDSRLMRHLPPCPHCGNEEYETEAGGESIIYDRFPYG
jgi:predicted RNA-binding Zn-ribbon protein involved in translation (DUF1610 family)